jgi:drug/metabolite transporter superfamily protein YnfA
MAAHMPANGNWAKFFACQRRAAFAPSVVNTPTHPFEADKFLKDRLNRDVLLVKVTMSRATAILLLLLAAALETGGDAIIKAGLHKNLLWQKTLLFALAGVVLFGYGWTVNSPPWEFGKLLGLYVVFFFVTAQILSWLVFKQPPSLAIVVGGAIIVAGGAIISMAKM